MSPVMEAIRRGAMLAMDPSLETFNEVKSTRSDDLMADAWQMVGETLSETLEAMGEPQ